MVPSTPVSSGVLWLAIKEMNFKKLGIKQLAKGPNNFSCQMLLEIQFLWVRLASADAKSHSRDAMLKNVPKILIIDLLVKTEIYVKSVTKIN